jgi:putative acetyltransferase
VVVLGHPGFYRKFGFRPASSYGLSNEYQAGEAFMALELNPGALENHKGLVKYAAEFKELDT